MNDLKYTLQYMCFKTHLEDLIEELQIPLLVCSLDWKLLKWSAGIEQFLAILNQEKPFNHVPKKQDLGSFRSTHQCTGPPWIHQSLIWNWVYFWHFSGMPKFFPRFPKTSAILWLRKTSHKKKIKLSFWLSNHKVCFNEDKPKRIKWVRKELPSDLWRRTIG